MDDPKIASCAVELRPRSELGRTQCAGIAGTHHFCFATYQRPDRLDWGALRALNHYCLEPGACRPPSFHSGFEIVTLVTSGHLRRLGTFTPRQLLHAGSAELVSASPGVELGAEAAGDVAAAYVEIWIKSDPRRREARRDWRASVKSDWKRPFASGPTASAGPMRMRADARIFAASMRAGDVAERMLDADHCAYLEVRDGRLRANGIDAGAGDGLAICGPGRLSVQARAPSSILLIVTAKLG